MTHQELQDQIATLQAQAKKLKLADKAAAVKTIKQLMADHGITVADLTVKKRAKVQPKYCNPANPSQTWTGRGRKPAWVKNYANLDDLLIPA